MDLDIEIGIELINKAYEKQLDEKLWQRWLVDYERMDGNNFIGFNEYKLNLIKTNKPDKPKTKKEIFEQSEMIIAAWKKGGDI